MKWGNKKDEENGCFLYYESAAVPASQFKRVGPKAIATNEIACENLSYQSKLMKTKMLLAHEVIYYNQSLLVGDSS